MREAYTGDTTHLEGREEMVREDCLEEGLSGPSLKVQIGINQMKRGWGRKAEKSKKGV